jgi:hypothetical protein
MQVVMLGRQLNSNCQQLGWEIQAGNVDLSHREGECFVVELSEVTEMFCI